MRVTCKAKTRPEVGEEVMKILERTTGPGLLTRDKIMEEMGVKIPLKSKHSKSDSGYIWIRQAITRFMMKYCKSPECPWERTDFVQQPSWRRK